MVAYKEKSGHMYCTVYNAQWIHALFAYRRHVREWRQTAPTRE